MQEQEKNDFEQIKEELINKTKPKGPVWILFIFLGIWIFIPLFILKSMISEKDFSLCLFPILFLIFEIIYIFKVFKRGNKYKTLAKCFLDETILIKKAEIIKFKYFYEHGSDTDFPKSGYTIIAKLGEQEFESERIENVIILGVGKEDIDKKFYEKKGMPFSPKDPKYDEYIKHIDIKVKQMEAEIMGLKSELENASWLKKIKIKNKIGLLYFDGSSLYPHRLTYRKHKYYIGDEINVYIDPHNSKNYIM